MAGTRILFITTELPWSPTSGGRIKTFRLLQFLARHFEVRLLCAYSMDHSSIDLFKEHSGVARVEVFQNYRQRTAIEWARALIRFPTFSTYRVFSPALYHRIRSAIGTADVVVVDHLAMMQMIPHDFLFRVIYHSHNAEFKLWEDLARLEHNPLKKTMIRWEAGRVREFEGHVIRSSLMTFACPSDKSVLIHRLQLSEEKFRHTYHLGDDSLLGLKAPSIQDNAPRVIYAGTLSWLPNSDGLEWFLVHCWPHILAVKPDATMVVCGSGASDKLKDLMDNMPGVEYRGFIDDLDSEMQACRVAVVPLRFGSGMKIKTFDALYRGLPLVTTSVGVEGIDVAHGCHAFVADDPRTFAEGVVLVLSDIHKASLLAREGRKLAARRYAYTPLLESMLRDIEGVLPSSDSSKVTAPLESGFRKLVSTPKYRLINRR